MKLTPREQRALAVTIQNIVDCTGADFGFSDEIVAALLGETAKAAGALLVSLKKKGLIFIDAYETDSSSGFQVCPSDELKDLLYTGASPEEIVAVLLARE